MNLTSKTFCWPSPDHELSQKFTTGGQQVDLQRSAVYGQKPLFLPKGGHSRKCPPPSGFTRLVRTSLGAAHDTDLVVVDWRKHSAQDSTKSVVSL
jgi:hypothetical protein